MGSWWRILGATVWLVVLVSANVEPTSPTESDDSSSPSPTEYDNQMSSTAEMDPQRFLWIASPVKVWTTLQALPVKLDHLKRRYRSIKVQELASGGCVGVWVAYIRNNMPIATNCIKSHPNWLWDNRDIIGDRPVRSLILPGMHNAGSYDLAEHTDAVTNWVICQDEDVLSQLLYGGRYLDLRVGYYPHTPEKFWINHDLVKWRPLKDVLLQIRTFVSKSMDPIFVDFHRFPVGFHRPEAMPLLLNLINSTLEHKNFLLSNWGPRITLNQIWNLNQSVILSLSNKTIAAHTDWIWPALPQAWADAQNPNDLRKFLDIQMAKRCLGERMWAAMLHMTPSFWDIIIRGDLGVRGMADMVAAPITRWLVNRWVHCANVVAVDFIRASNIVEVSIELNTNMEAIVALVNQTEKILSNKIKIFYPENDTISNGKELTDVSHRTWRTTDSSERTTKSPDFIEKINKPLLENQKENLQNIDTGLIFYNQKINSKIEEKSDLNPVL
ncbi:unnamed protein product [Meganyctiphanes norvegica]|uniref:PI-PLC X domain-containing protein 1 n=1 Tax=Meganyctiphanes norvegica TaxID=48144 RepID=A0AAV2QBK6_MEGNR